MKQRKTWRCFHCNEVFRSAKDAALHFGHSERTVTACQIDVAAVRAMERELARYREEDTDLHRQIRSLESAHQTALMRAEESGYAKGLRDGRDLQKEAA